VRLKSVFKWIILQSVISAIIFSPAFSSVIPKDMKITDTFKLGFGRPVGEVKLSMGKVVIQHRGTPEGFLAEKGLPLYNGDTLFTGEKGKIRFKLNDGSIITLSSSTKLVINKSIYKPGQKRRSSFLKMIIGKARFFVTKMFKFREKAFKVKTSTFVAGVRGSDFIITAKEKTANLTALKDTAVEVTSFAAPEKPVIVKDFQRTIVPKGMPPGRVMDIPMDEIKKLEKIFDLSKGQDDQGKKNGSKDKAGDKDAKSDKRDTRIPVDMLVQPGATVEPDYHYEPEEPIYPEKEETLHDEENKDLNEQIVEEIRQEVVEDELPEGENIPNMPDTPQ